MYAIIETGGKQLKVEVGDTIFVEKLDVAEGEEVVLDKVLFIGDKTNKIGNPYIKGATVTAQVEKHGKEKKVLIYKYNPKKHYHKKQGHRQPYTKLVIKDIKKTTRKAKQEASEAAEQSAEYGKDLVCAGVSTICVGIANTLVQYQFLLQHLGTIDLKEGLIDIKVHQDNEQIQVVLGTFEVMLKTVEESYSKYMKIEKMEV